MEKEIKIKSNGFVNLFLGLMMLLSPVLIIFTPDNPLIISILVIISVVGLFWLFGLFVITPNNTKVLIFFGKYKGTVKQDGFFWRNPFLSKKKISLRVRNLETEEIKVNDEQGNPILISAVVVWKIVDTYKAVFDIEVTKELDSKSGEKHENREKSYQNFVKIQSEAALRSIAHKYPYDDVEEGNNTITLRSGVNDINNDLEQEIRERLKIAGIEIIEARISNLSYAPEIAAIMLQRQQAQAILGARKKIVEGSVGIVKMALKEMESTLNISENEKIAMINNLLVILSSDKGVSPVIQTNL